MIRRSQRRVIDARLALHVIRSLDLWSGAAVDQRPQALLCHGFPN